MNHRVLVSAAAALLSCVITIACVRMPFLSAPDPLQTSLDNISAQSLRGNLSFLASDALEGRWTPSPGLNIAAEFIASRFRAAGVAPGNKGSYFQQAGLNTRPPATTKNIVAILPGADPTLRNTYVILSAHYDHLGTLATAGRLTKDKVAIHGDTIFNGANDDGSGTVSVIEIAAALRKAHYQPKRSIVFILFCGEELGELGSEYYTKDPVYPLSKTVADINLEQIGRSDSDFGKGRASLTGYGYTNMTKLFQDAAKRSGFTLIKAKGTDAYFEDSDNYSFALVGIPDVTFATSFNFGDYHGLKDEWTKIDFPDLARANQLATRVLLNVADSPTAPQWEAANPKTKKYREAQTARWSADPAK